MRRWPRWGHPCHKPLCKSKWQRKAGGSCDRPRKQGKSDLSHSSGASCPVWFMHRTIKGTFRHQIREPYYDIHQSVPTRCVVSIDIIFAACLPACLGPTRGYPCRRCVARVEALMSCAVTLLVLQSRSAMADAAVSADFRNQNQFPACHRRLRSRA
jgi:hypothetical protein